MIINRWDNRIIKSAKPLLSSSLYEQAYVSRLLGSEPDLALHGGGNTSVKDSFVTRTGKTVKALYIKPSGCNLAHLQESDFLPLDLEYLNTLKSIVKLSDEELAEEFALSQLRVSDVNASVETLLHAFLPFTYINHTHPTAILAMTNRKNGAEMIHRALGDDIVVVPYERVGLELSKVVMKKLQDNPSCRAIILMHHGLVTWGETAKDAYNVTIEITAKAEQFLDANTVMPIMNVAVDEMTVMQRYGSIAPVIRGIFCNLDSDGNADGCILEPVLDDQIRTLIDLPYAKKILETSPLTPDLTVRAGLMPLFIDGGYSDDNEIMRSRILEALDRYRCAYCEYIGRNDKTGISTVKKENVFPSTIFIPGIGCVCIGKDVVKARITTDIARQALTTKFRISFSKGEYESINEDHCFDMEYRSFQTAKVKFDKVALQGKIAVVTGSAGAIGSGIADLLLKHGCHVALADLDNDVLNRQFDSYREHYGELVLKAPVDVTSEDSLESVYRKIVMTWGGLDIAIVNAGIAHVAPLVEMELESFRKLERVNVEGTLLTIKGAAGIFENQRAGGDIVLISTKNVFAPGAKFGAYSATKAAAHQLARIAVLELADMKVRVNMVAPDAVFSHGETKSGLWATVGPDRMRARGLDEKGLEEYYRSRNLLKAKVTAEHVANAVMFYVTHQTPTTGGTIPVDGGLPDATPR